MKRSVLKEVDRYDDGDGIDGDDGDDDGDDGDDDSTERSHCQNGQGGRASSKAARMMPYKSEPSATNIPHTARLCVLLLSSSTSLSNMGTVNQIYIP